MIVDILILAPSAVFPSWQGEYDMILGIVNWVRNKKFKIRAVRVHLFYKNKRILETIII